MLEGNSTRVNKFLCLIGDIYIFCYGKLLGKRLRNWNENVNVACTDIGGLTKPLGDGNQKRWRYNLDAFARGRLDIARNRELWRLKKKAFTQ